MDLVINCFVNIFDTFFLDAAIIGAMHLDRFLMHLLAGNETSTIDSLDDVMCW